MPTQGGECGGRRSCGPLSISLALTFSGQGIVGRFERGQDWPQAGPGG
jgi:hypothetical protein